MYAEVWIFNGTDAHMDDHVHRASVSFPYGLDDAGENVLVQMAKPGEWVHIWDKKLLVDGRPHRLRLSVMEDGNGEAQETSISGSYTPGSSTLKPEDFS